ncbi:MAG: PAS domain-containing protein, partial [Victivallaceae bacterium]|nr:PAS domain-containing protein [Victivallaceae bacterium]
MAAKKNLLDRFGERFDDLDAATKQAYLLRLARERGFFETVFNAVDEGIMVIDRQLKLRYFNRAAKELLALPDDVSEVRVAQLLPDLDWQLVLQDGEKQWNKVARQEIEILYPEKKFVQLYLVPLPEDRELAAVILRDVSESRRRAKDEMERETDQAVSLLAAGVAHEIGNPLNSLYLNLQLLETSAPGTDPAETKEMLAVCKKEVERLDSIIHRFLGAVRPGKGAFSMQDVEKLIVEVLHFMRAEIEARKVEVKCDFAANLPAVSGNADQLKQAFYNIIRNAVQAMRNGGTLGIYGYPENEALVVEFADTGSGVAPASDGREGRAQGGG